MKENGEGEKRERVYHMEGEGVEDGRRGGGSGGGGGGGCGGGRGGRVVEEKVAAAGLEAALQEVCIHGDEVECGGRKEEGREMLLLPAWSLELE